jgi:hypothetical protein
MRLSAGRIRSLSIRYALAESAAFPGIGTERVSPPHHCTASVAFGHNHSRTAQKA